MLGRKNLEASLDGFEIGATGPIGFNLWSALAAMM
jgi:hypothetical protein